MCSVHVKCYDDVIANWSTTAGLSSSKEKGALKGSSDATCTFTLFEHKCVLAVCTQSPYNDKVIKLAV